MKRNHSESGKENNNVKRQKVIHSSYYGKILDGKRDGIQKIIVSGSCEPLGMICPFVKGIKHGECYTFSLNNGKLINCSVFENGQIVQQLDLSRIEITNGILDFPDGSRWEGAICGDRSSGRGKWYSVENNVIYDGMCINNKREGYGISYYDVSNWKQYPEYIGDWMYDQFFGHGKLYDKKGNLVNDNDWFEGTVISYSQTITKEEEHRYLPSLLHELTIASDCLNTLNEFDLNKFERLKTFTVGDHCFQKITQFAITKHHTLETVTIGDCCFSTINRNWRSQKQAEQIVKQQSKVLHVTHNSHLKNLTIGNNSFTDYLQFLLEDCPKLEKLTIGKASTLEDDSTMSFCFFYATSLTLQNLPSLVEVELGSGTFFSVTSVVFQDLPELVSIQFGCCCCYGDNQSTDIINHVQFKNLPSLSILVAYAKSFYNFFHISVDNLPCLDNSSSIRLTKTSFNFINRIFRGTNVSSVFINQLSTTYVNRNDE